MNASSVINAADSGTDFYNVMIPVEMFGKTRVLIGMVISGFCVLSFLVYLFWTCCMKHKDAKTKKLSSGLLNSSVFLLVLYFGLEFANAVLLIIGQLRIIQYYPSVIILDFISLFADSTMLSFLLIELVGRIYDHSGKDKFTIVLFNGYCWVVNTIALLNIPAFLWKGVEGIIPDDAEAEFYANAGLKFRILGSYEALNVSFYGVYFGGILALIWVSISYLRKLGKANTVKTFIPIVITCLCLRTGGKFIYSILFVLQGRTKTPLMQLIHIVFYGILSVIIYGSLMLIIRSDNFTRDIPVKKSNIQYHLTSQDALVDNQIRPDQVYVYNHEVTHYPYNPPVRGHAASYYDEMAGHR